MTTVELGKVTKERRGEDKRRYDDACAAAHGMDLIGERWSMPLIRELLFGPRRFSDLRASLNGISANVLTQRLEGLESAGVLSRRKLPPPGSVQVYELTPWGYQAAPIFAALGRWAVRSPQHDPTRPFSPVSLMLSLRTMLDAGAAQGFDASIVFQIGKEAYHWIKAGDEVKVGRGAPENPDLVMAAPNASTIAAAIYGGAPMETVLVEGDVALARRFPSLFILPEKAATSGVVEARNQLP
jgi:DNA-binding HxlR family transcriptional regulator